MEEPWHYIQVGRTTHGQKFREALDDTKDKGVGKQYEIHILEKMYEQCTYIKCLQSVGQGRPEGKTL